MKVWQLAFLMLLGLAVLLSGIAVVYVKYLTRQEFNRLQTATRQLHRLEEEWTMLQLEEAALSTHPRVEQIARKKLHMYLPGPESIRTVSGGIFR